MRIIKVKKPICDIRGKQLEDKEKKLTVGDMLLNLLSQNIALKENREAFWVTEIGIQIADGKAEIELSEDKWAFLKRLVEANKFKQPGLPVEEIYWLPFVLGQMLALFQEEEKPKK